MAVPPERMMLTAAQVEAQIGVALAGRAAEELIFGTASITSGAANDLQQATELTARMCMEWGMDADSGLAVRRVLTAARGRDATEQLLGMLEKTRSNQEFFKRLKEWLAIWEKEGYNLGSVRSGI